MAGYQRVIACGKTGSKLIAFRHAGRCVSLECRVFGWLRTGGEQTIVVAEEMIFHVGRDTAAAARERMEDPDAGDWLALAHKPTT